MQARHTELCNSFHQQSEIKRELSVCITALHREINMLKREQFLPAEISPALDFFPYFDAPLAEQGFGQGQCIRTETETKTHQLLEQA